MSPRTPRPIGAIVVAVLLFLSAAFGIVSGVMTILGGVAGATADVEGVALNSTSLLILGGFWLVVGLASLILAFGILRGSRVARIVVTIVQVLALAGGVGSMIAAGRISYDVVQGVLFPLAIISILWSGDQMRAFFAKD